MAYRRKHVTPKIKRLKLKKRFYKKPVFWIILGLVALISLLYVVLFFQKFQVKNIEISGNEKINKGDIENIIWPDVDRKIVTMGILNISSQSIFVVDTNNVVEDILHKIPMIESVQVQRKMPDSLILKIKERKSFAVFCQSNNCFSIDENGIIFELLQNPLQDVIVLREEQTKEQIFLGENVVDKNIINIINKVKNNLKNNFQIDIKEVFVSNPLVFKTSENWQLYFDPTSTIDLQITKMNILLKNEILPNVRKNLQYIYLQYKGRAYYK